MYVYQITNIINDDFYIGKYEGKYLQSYLRTMQRECLEGNPRCNNRPHLFRAMRKYGPENFFISPLMEVDTRDEVRFWEAELIAISQAQTLGYNISPGWEPLSVKGRPGLKGEKNGWFGKGLWGEDNPFFGKKHSAETGAKIAESNRNRIWTEETRKKTSASIKARNEQMTSDQKEAIRQAMLGVNNPFYGKTHSEETRSKISEANTGKLVGEKNPFYGKTHSEETRQKMRDGRARRKAERA